MRVLLVAVIACGVIGLVANAQAQGTRPIEVSPTGQTAVKTYQRAEWRIDVDRKYDNPFDPDKIAVDVQFVGPNNTVLTTPAFWNTTAANPEGAFFVRFAPPVAGDWSMVAMATDANGQRSSAAQTFTVAASDSTGFVRVADNHRYLKFDNGKTYFPVGINLSWAPRERGVDWYDENFTKLSTNGGNYARVWMCDPPTMLETSATSARKFNLKSAEYFDRVLELGEQRGVRIMLCFLNHRELLEKDMWGPAPWPDSAYNAKNGGPATQPADFFSNKAASDQFKVRLRYIVARYGAYSSLAFWELFNEEEGTGLKVPAEWNLDKAAYIKQIDPYKHPITTSSRPADAVWESADFAITQAHFYGDGTLVDLVSPIPGAAKSHRRFDKPFLMGEFGIDYHGGDYSFDPKGKATAFHNSLWAGATSGSAGTAIYWWWDNYVDSKNLWGEYRPIANFVSTIDFANRNFAPIDITDVHRKEAGGDILDLVLSASGNWETVTKETVTVSPSGHANQLLPRFLRGPMHKDLYAPLTFAVDLPKPGNVVINVNGVSDYGLLRVSVDGKPVSDFAFSGLPGAPESSKNALNADSGFFHADLNSKRMLPAELSAGKHEVKLDLIAGDWITLSNVTFTQALDARYANLSAVAVQDEASRETLAWIYDTRSNWKMDQTQDAPPPMQGVEVAIPNVTTGSFSADWWDTRAGKIIETKQVAAVDGKLIVAAPVFTRDIALRLRSAERNP